jgi:hypothetical protein
MPIRKRTVAEAKSIIHDPELCHSAEKAIAAHIRDEIYRERGA